MISAATRVSTRRKIPVWTASKTALLRATSTFVVVVHSVAATQESVSAVPIRTALLIRANLYLFAVYLVAN